MSTRYTPRTGFMNLPDEPSRSRACRHARPERRRRPLAITVMRIPMLCSSNLLPREASPGVTRTRSRPAPHRGERSCVSRSSIGLPKMSSGASTRSSNVDLLRIRIPQEQLQPDFTPLDPPTAVPEPPCRHGEPRDPRQASHGEQDVLLGQMGARTPGIPIEGGAPRPRTGWRPPPNETPLPLYVMQIGEVGPPRPPRGTGTGVPGPSGSI